MDYFIHESSYVDQAAEIGRGTKLWHFCHVMPGARLGKNCTVGQNVFIGSDVVIADGVKIQNNVSIYTGVIIEDDVFLGPSMVFTNVVNPRSRVTRRHEYRTTLVKRGVTIGANATIVCGVTLGRYAFVGAGAVITKDVPDYALVYGSPIRIRGWMCQCGTKLRFEANGDEETASCQRCLSQYSKKGEIVTPVKTEESCRFR